LHLDTANRQESRWTIRIYAEEKATFWKGVWYL